MKTKTQIVRLLNYALRNCAGLLAMIVLASIGQKNLAAQPAVDPAHAAHVAAGIMPPDSVKGDPFLSQQISELQVKVAQLEATLALSAPSMAPVPAGAAMAGMPGAAPAANPPMSMGMEKMKSRGMGAGAMPAPTGAAMAGMPAAGPVANPPMSMGMEKMKARRMGAGAMPAPAMASMSPPEAPPAGGMMGMMDKMMGMMDKMMSMPGGAMPAMPAPAATPAGGMAMMQMDKMEMAGMMGMAPMGGGASGASMPQSALPGFPGASHLYHLGATGFFLDHPQHIALSTEQTAALNKAKEQSLLAKSTADRAIEQAEQELWTLTASDQPDAAKIEAKVRQTEKLTGDSRLAFVRAVGDASKILTDEQRKILTGFAPPAPAMSAAPAPAMAPMKGM